MPLTTSIPAMLVSADLCRDIGTGLPGQGSSIRGCWGLDPNVLYIYKMWFQYLLEVAHIKSRYNERKKDKRREGVKLKNHVPVLYISLTCTIDAIIQPASCTVTARCGGFFLHNAREAESPQPGAEIWLCAHEIPKCMPVQLCQKLWSGAA